MLDAGERPAGLRSVLERADPDEASLLALLRRAVPVKLLELLGTAAPWSDNPRLAGGVVLSPRAPRPLAQRLLPALYWRDLAEVAACYRLPAALRMRAEALLVERLGELRVGDRIALGRLATPAVLRALLYDADERVVRACLPNPRLPAPDLVQALLNDAVPVPTLRQAAASPRWNEIYAVRLALVLQPRTPLGVALAQLTSLIPRDLLRIADSQKLAPLVRASARRVIAAGRNRDA